MSSRKLLSHNLKRLRAIKVLNQEQLADKSGVSRTMIALVESGKNFCSDETLDLLADGLKVDPSELFKRMSNEDELIEPGKHSKDLSRFIAAFLAQGPSLQKIVLSLVFEDLRYLDDLPPEHRRAVVKSLKG